jgi:hypothetical protein
MLQTHSPQHVEKTNAPALLVRYIASLPQSEPLPLHTPPFIFLPTLTAIIPSSTTPLLATPLAVPPASMKLLHVALALLVGLAGFAAAAVNTPVEARHALSTTWDNDASSTYM